MAGLARRKTLKNKGREGQKRLASRPLERRLAFSHITNVQAKTSASELETLRLHRPKPGPIGGRDIETVAQWRTILMRTYDLTPFYRSTVGFDRLFSLLDQATSDGSPGYPPYNIERTGENAYRISVAVSGFAKEELSIVAKENTLTIKGEKVANENGKDKAEVLYRGIAARAFERAFQLADFVVVKNASLEHGLLHVDLVREIPEAKKPRSIPISTGAVAPQVVDGSAAKAA
jgi:molecular chaperone IbpA